MSKGQDNELRILELSWQPAKQQPAVLKGITSTLEQGKFYGILGPNGSGKTSLIKHLLRIYSVENDAIILDGKELNAYQRKSLAKKVSFVPQNTDIDADFSVYDIVAMGRTPYQKKFTPLSRQDMECVEYALQITESKPLEKKSFKYLSGGEKQRVLVARAIAQDTPWIILDEPISHLDIKHQVNVMETLKKRNEKSGCTIIAILHDINLAASYCNEILLMKDGKVFSQGSVEQVLTKENLLSVYEMEFDIIENHKNNRPYFVPSI